MVKAKTIFKIFEEGRLDLIAYFIVVALLGIFLFKNTLYNYLGVFFVVGGFIIWLKGRKDLGKSFQIIPEAKKLVTKGIYSKIRHPIYFGSFVVDIGFIVYSFKSFIFYYFIVYTLIMLVVQIIRIKKEEKVLIDRFGKKYIIYKRRTWF